MGKRWVSLRLRLRRGPLTFLGIRNIFRCELAEVVCYKGSGWSFTTCGYCDTHIVLAWDQHHHAAKGGQIQNLAQCGGRLEDTPQKKSIEASRCNPPVVSPHRTRVCVQDRSVEKGRGGWRLSRRRRSPPLLSWKVGSGPLRRGFCRWGSGC